MFKLRKDCNVQTKKGGKTPLMTVLDRGMEYIKPLIEKGAKPKYKEQQGSDRSFTGRTHGYVVYIT
jgi:hypothetical protein